MAKAITLAAAAYKLVWVRVALYILIPCATAFLAASDKITDDQWEAMRTFSRWKFFALIAVPGLSSLTAYLDQSFSRAREEHKQAKRENTIANMNPNEAP